MGALLVGLVLGALAGRASARGREPDPLRAERGPPDLVPLRVVSLHREAGTPSLAGGGERGADLALHRTGADLRQLLKRAPWVSQGEGSKLVADAAEARRAAGRGPQTRPSASVSISWPGASRPARLVDSRTG